MSSNQSVWNLIATQLIKLKKRQFFKSAQLNHRWRRHLAEVESNRIYYRSPHHPEVRSRRVWPRWTEILGVPFFWVCLWYIQSILVVSGYARFHTLVDTPLKLMLLGVKIIPFEIRKNFGILIFMCANSFMLCFPFQVFCPLDRFNFLSIFVCNKLGSIKPKHLRLEETCFQKFSKLRRHVERAYHILILWTTFTVTSTWIILSILLNTFSISYILSLFNFISCYFWVISVCQALYAISIQATLVCYYIVRKQRALLLQIKQTHEKKKFGLAWMMLRRYDRLRGEISDYNRFWCVHITILVNCHAIIFTYLVYQAFLQNPPPYLFFVFVSSAINSMICLCLLLQFSRVAHHDRILRKHLVLLLSAVGGKVTPRNCVVIQLMLQNIRSRPTGFTSIDNRLVNSNSYLEIFINTTIVFFFACKKSKIN